MINGVTTDASVSIKEYCILLHINFHSVLSARPSFWLDENTAQAINGPLGAVLVSLGSLFELNIRGKELHLSV
jgi:hypothetical protein